MTTSARSVALTFGCISLLTSFSILAHDAAGTGDANYTGDGSKHLLTDGFGDCVRTGTGDKDAHCGEMPKAPEPAPEPAAEAAPAEAPVPEPAVPQTITKAVSLGAGALFDLNKATLKPAGQAELDQLASDLGKLTSIESITIVGHTDSTGAASYNQSLSEKRANSVRDYLIGKGVDPALMNASGMGETSPVADNSTRDGRAQNRRVEITIKGTSVE